MMLIAEGVRPGKRMILLGLTMREVEALMAGEPIHLARETHGDLIPADLEIGLIYGRAESELVMDLVGAGLIGNPVTKCRVV
jgi:hypothetical protein